MSAPIDSNLPEGWAERLLSDIAELRAAAETLAEGGSMAELPDRFILALREAAPSWPEP
jgi:hypothetical protein